MLGREVVQRLRVERREASACLVQKLFRGFQTRKELRIHADLTRRRQLRLQKELERKEAQRVRDLELKEMRERRPLVVSCIRKIPFGWKTKAEVKEVKMSDVETDAKDINVLDYLRCLVKIYAEILQGKLKFSISLQVLNVDSNDLTSTSEVTSVLSASSTSVLSASSLSSSSSASHSTSSASHSTSHSPLMQMQTCIIFPLDENGELMLLEGDLESLHNNFSVTNAKRLTKKLLEGKWAKPFLPLASALVDSLRIFPTENDEKWCVSCYPQRVFKFAKKINGTFVLFSLNIRSRTGFIRQSVDNIDEMIDMTEVMLESFTRGAFEQGCFGMEITVTAYDPRDSLRSQKTLKGEGLLRIVDEIEATLEQSVTEESCWEELVDALVERFQVFRSMGGPKGGQGKNAKNVLVLSLNRLKKT